MRLINEQLKQILEVELQENVLINYGYGLDVANIEEDVKNEKIFYMIQSRNVTSDVLSSSSFAQITTASVLFWTAASVARNAVLAMQKMIAVGFSINNRIGQRAATPFILGSKRFYFFEPIGGFFDESADKFGSVWLAQQLMRLQFESE